MHCVSAFDFNGASSLASTTGFSSFGSSTFGSLTFFSKRIAADFADRITIRFDMAVHPAFPFLLFPNSIFLVIPIKIDGIGAVAIRKPP
jgi:hypothetical protein